MISETIRHETMGTLYVYDTLDDIDQNMINSRTMLLAKSEFDDLYNDKKPEGNALLDFLGIARPRPTPLPSKISLDEYIYNMMEYGFDLVYDSIPRTTRIIRPEYIITKAFNTMENHSRFVGFGTAIIMYTQNINWGLMIYEATRLNFARRLYGVMLQTLYYTQKTALYGVIDLFEKHGILPEIIHYGNVGEKLEMYLKSYYEYNYGVKKRGF